MKQKIIALLIFPFILFSEQEAASSVEIPIQKFSIEKKKELVAEPTVEPKPQPPVNEVKDNEEEEDALPASAARSPAFVDSGYQKKFLTTLVFVCILILFSLIVIYIYRKGAPMSTITKKNTKNNIKILERRTLSPQTYLYHVQVGDNQFILSESKVDVRNVANLSLLAEEELK